MSCEGGEEVKPLDDEEVAQKAMGDFGRWQLLIVLWLSLLKLPIAWNQLGIVFLAAPVSYHCTGSNLTCSTDDGYPCTSWDYDRSVFAETIITQWDLVCEKEQMANITQMILMMGMMLGSVVFSVAADSWGRKMPLVLSGVMQMVAGTLAAYSPWFTIFVFLHFLQAIATGAALTIGFVLCMEVLSGKWRTFIMTLSQIPFAIGLETMVAIAYYTRTWKHFQLAISVPSAIVIFYLWLVPESPRWLLAVGRHEEAVKLLRKAAATNNNPMPEVVSFAKTKKLSAESVKMKQPSFLDLVRTPNMRKKTLVMAFNWLACGLCFNGLEQYAGIIGGNIFVNSAIVGSFTVPGNIVLVLTIDRFGRKATMIGGQLLTAISCLLIMFFSEVPGQTDIPRVTLTSLGLMGAWISFPTAYLYSGELFPTVVRNIGVGSGSMCARIGCMIAAFITSLSVYGDFVPPLLFGVFPLLAAILALLLPDTRHSPMLHTLEEGEAYGKKKMATVTPPQGLGNEGFQTDNQPV